MGSSSSSTRTRTGKRSRSIRRRPPRAERRKRRNDMGEGGQGRLPPRLILPERAPAPGLQRFALKHLRATCRQGPVGLPGRYEMTRSTLFDRLNQELSEFGKKAQAALDEGKLQIELLRYR